MKLTVNQLRRIIKEEVSKVIVEQQTSFDWRPFNQSEWIQSAKMDQDRGAMAAYKKLAASAASMLGKQGTDVMVLDDDPSADEAFVPSGATKQIMVWPKREWTFQATVGTLDGETVVQLVDDDSGMISYAK